MPPKHFVNEEYRSDVPQQTELAQTAHLDVPIEGKWGFVIIDDPWS